MSRPDWQRHFRLLLDVREHGRVTTRAQVDAIDAAVDLLRLQAQRAKQRDDSTARRYSVKRLRDLNEAASCRGNGVPDEHGQDPRKQLYMALMVMADDLIDALEIVEGLAKA